MLIRVQDLELRDFLFEETYAAGEIALEEGLRQVGQLKTQGKAVLLREHDGRIVVNDIRLTMTISVQLEGDCARCLEAVPLAVERDFDFLYRPHKAEGKSGETGIHEAETEIGFYAGEGVELEDTLREAILLTLPTRWLCQAECKGLCSMCGQNKNQGECGCSPAIDERWSSLEGLKKL